MFNMKVEFMDGQGESAERENGGRQDPEGQFQSSRRELVMVA